MRFVLAATFMVACTTVAALLFVEGANAHFVAPRVPVPRMTLHRESTWLKWSVRHYEYVCKEGSGKVKRSHCVAYKWAAAKLHTVKLELDPFSALGFPPHHALWMCIHGGEGAWNDQDSGHNGHYGGLQMHPGWGYGTSYYASEDSQLVQEWAAEKGYRSSGYSSVWLNGQWGQTIGPCWSYV